MMMVDVGVVLGDGTSIAAQLVEDACASGLLKSEPDIVQSTKTSLDMEYGLGPVAPPRRKRKTKADHSVPPTIPEISTIVINSVGVALKNCC